jgi:hypothetical protein
MKQMVTKGFTARAQSKSTTRLGAVARAAQGEVALLL